MAKADLINQLTALGFVPQEPDAGRVYFEYEIPVGKNIGKKVLIGFEIGDNYPMSCPTGPHIKPLSEGWLEHPQNIQDSPSFGSGWRYWSRPFNEWNRSEKDVKTYLAHVKNIMMSV